MSKTPGETPNEAAARRLVRVAAHLLLTDPKGSHEPQDIVAMATTETERFVEEAA